MVDNGSTVSIMPDLDIARLQEMLGPDHQLNEWQINIVTAWYSHPGRAVAVVGRRNGTATRGHHPDVAVTVKPKTRGHRLPEDFIPRTADRQKLIEEFPFITRDEWVNQHKIFCDYWVSTPGQRGNKLDWDAAWRVWMRKQFSSPMYRHRASKVASTVDQKIMDMQGMKE